MNNFTHNNNPNLKNTQNFYSNNINNCTSPVLNQVSISSLNVKNLKSNMIYSKFLTGVTDISFFSELWLKQSEFALIQSLNPNKRFLFKSDMDPYNHKRGRPFGGLAWVIDSEFEVLDFEFFSRYCSFIHLKKGAFEIAIIGIYMPFDDPNNRIDSLNNFETTLSILRSLIERFSYNDIPTISLGDFNSDIFRNKRFDKLLFDFILNNNLLNLSQLFTQKIDHTFPNELFLTNNPKFNLDHVLINTKSLELFLSIQCNIVDD
jgi:hypothetical protein